MKTFVHFWYLAHFFLEWKNISDKSCRENQNTRFTFNNFSSFENPAVYEMWEKYCTAGQATDDNMAHAHYMLDN